MKIEIGESLLLSWLRHSKNCQLVQMNWKPSVSSWDLQNENEIEDLMIKSRKHFLDKYGIDIYKKNSSYMQLLQQAEIDVIGMSILQDDTQEIYAIDVAFHEAGLNYGDKYETASRVVKKVIRTAMCLYGYFGFKKGYIIFASPKIYNSVLEILNPYIDDIKEIFEGFNLQYEIRLIANDDFAEKILDPVIASSSLVADTSELFMRSVQMYHLFSEKKKSISRKRKTSVNENKAINVNVQTTNKLDEMKIGVLVRSSLIRLFKEKKISKEEIEKMTTSSYSKEVFNLNYPVLKEVDKNIPLSEQKKDHRGYNRYWNFTVDIYGKQYLICSQWVEELHRNSFNKWLGLRE